MRNRLREGVDWLRCTMRRTAAELVVYTRGSGGTKLQIPATFGQTEIEYDDGQGRIHARQRDFIIDAEDLVVNGARVLPAAGDTVAWFDADRGQTLTYEVMPIGDKHYEPADSFHRQWRIHARLISTG